MNKRMMFGVVAAAIIANPARANEYDDFDKAFFNKATHDASLQTFAAQYPATDASTTAIIVDSVGRHEILVGNTIGVTFKTVNFNSGKISLRIDTERYDSKSLMLTSRDSLIGEVDYFTEIKSIKTLAAFDPKVQTSADTKADYMMWANDVASSQRTYDKYTETCHLSVTASDVIARACTEKGDRVNDPRHSSDDSSIDRKMDQKWFYSADFKTYLPGIFGPPEFAGAVDYKVGAAPWRSQTVSAALTPDQKQAANTLFAQGFDLYRGGDFIGAQTLINKGLETDPANVLAWFTLGEINRAAWKTKGDQEAAKTGYYDYMRVIDLAPKDSAQALLATNYLKDGGMN
jgi:hypothetical protein